MNESFGKEYKLCSQKKIQEIFDERKSLRSYPFVMHYKVVNEDEKTRFQVVVSAPKRTFRKATDRNRIKRLMRESIRKNKLYLEPFLAEQNIQLALFMIYTSKEELPLDKLMKKTQQLFKQLINNLENDQTN
jgi:ribonuclease P protein component